MFGMVVGPRSYRIAALGVVRGHPGLGFSDDAREIRVCGRLAACTFDLSILDCVGRIWKQIFLDGSRTGGG